MKLAFIGLGNMGFPMAGHLAEHFSDSYQIGVYNRSNAKAIDWQNKHPGIAQSLAEVVQDANYIMLCLGRDEDVLSIVESPEFYEQLRPEAIVIDHTTTSASLSRRLKQFLSHHSVHFIDAPVSGGQDGAQKGTLSTMVGGEASIVEKAKPFLQTYCTTITHIGDVGSGQLTKMVNQICIAGVLSGLSEGLKFAEEQGMAIDKVLSAISGGAAQSWQMQNRGHTMHQREFDFGFAIEWFLKDLSYCLTQAKASDTPLPNTQRIYEQFEAIANQAARLDTSALITYYDQMDKG